MITALHTATLFFTDQDRALDFYVNKLGFEKREDQPMGPDSRWIEVVPPGARTAILLYKPTPQMPGAASYELAQQLIGTFTPILLSTDDLQATGRDLRAKGVQFPTPPEREP